MSSKTSKSAAAENKSKTKALLLMLEKVISGQNSDKEQTRFMSHKLLHLVNTHDAAKKEISSKASLEVIISILESCTDQPTCLTLVNILSEIAAGNGMKRLINHDVTRVLLHTVAYLGKEADNRLLIALLGLSVKIAPKDRRFALRVRLAGALPVLVSIVRSSSSSSSNKLLTSTLQCLKICAANGVNSSILGRIGAVHIFQKLVLSVGRKQPSIVKTALSALSLLVKSRSNTSRAISGGLISSMLATHQEWHKNDYKSHKHIPTRKSMLMILKHLTTAKRGKTAFVDAGGIRILHRTCRECATMVNAKPAEPLLNMAAMVLRRCQPGFRLPIPTVQCSFKFQLPQVVSKIEDNDARPQDAALVDDVIDASDEDDEEEVASDIQELENEELLEEERKLLEEAKQATSTSVPVVVPPASGGIQPKRAAADLKAMYEKFFPELWEFQTEIDDALREKFDIRDTVFLRNWLLQKLRQASMDCGQAMSGDTLMTGFSGTRRSQNAHLGRARSEANVLSMSAMTPSYEPPPSAPAPSLCPGDEHSSLMASLASSTRTQKQAVNTVSLADYFGNIPPPLPEPQVAKRYGIQRIRMLDDVARTLRQGDIMNKVVYSRDESYRPPKSDDDWPYDFQQCSDIDVLREILSNGCEEASAVLQEPVSFEETTPIIRNACNFGSSRFSSTDFPATNCENGSGFSSLAEETVKEKPPLNFRSDFECGNLRTAIQVRELEYDLVLDADCNTNHHHQWFYFEVSRISAGVPYRLNIVNCEKSSSQFNAGMQPLMYSVAEARLGNPCWRRAGANLCYYKSHFSRSSASAGGVKGKSYFTTSFTVTFLHNKDVCYFAYHYPYTYTQLQVDLHKLVAEVDEKEVYVRVQTFCQSLGQNPVPVLTITAQPTIQEDEDIEKAISEFCSRPYIFLSARVHPGESNSSWTMRGTLKLLLSSKNSTNLSSKLIETADLLRKSYIFKVVPMLNPDGVINGHHRCSLTGEDLNRQWTDPDPTLFPTIYHAKGLLQYLHSIGKAPLVYCDYHGHSRRKNVFMYGCSRRESVIAGETEALRGAPDDTGYKTLPKLLNRMAPAFSMSNCNFVVERCKETTARVVVWKEMGVARSYTMESTYCGCDQGKYKGYQIGTHELEEMGMNLCEALLHLKDKDSARRLPSSGLSEEDAMYTSLSDVSSSDLPSIDSETRQKNRESNGIRDLSSGSDCIVPTNSDEELTPDDTGSVASFSADDDRFLPEGALIGRYSREFWDYNEFCRGFGFGPEEEDYDITPRAGDDVTSSQQNDLHNHQRGDCLMTSPYHIFPDTGAVMYEESRSADAMLSSIMERNSLCDKGRASKS